MMKADSDNNKKITYPEFRAFMFDQTASLAHTGQVSNLQKKNVATITAQSVYMEGFAAKSARMKKMFAVADHDKSGTLSSDEARGVLKKYGYNDAEVDVIYAKMDADNNGSLNFREFERGLLLSEEKMAH
jgi:Ca2+-binding EF-hand superfamily protein